MGFGMFRRPAATYLRGAPPPGWRPPSSAPLTSTATTPASSSRPPEIPPPTSFWARFQVMPRHLRYYVRGNNDAHVELSWELVSFMVLALIGIPLVVLRRDKKLDESLTEMIKIQSSMLRMTERTYAFQYHVISVLQQNHKEIYEIRREQNNMIREWLESCSQPQPGSSGWNWLWSKSKKP